MEGEIIYTSPEEDANIREVRNEIGDVLAVIGVDQTVELPPLNDEEKAETENK